MVSGRGDVSKSKRCNDCSAVIYAADYVHVWATELRANGVIHDRKQKDHIEIVQEAHRQVSDGAE